MSIQPKHYAKSAGIQLSQADGYAVLNYSKAKRLAEATRAELRTWACKLYQYQEAEEKMARESFIDNGVGFAKFQATALTNFAQSNTGDTEKLRQQVGYHWGQIMLLCEYWKKDTAEALERGLLKCRKYAGKGTEL